MHLESWKRDKLLVDWAAATFATAHGKLFLAMLEASNPKNYQRSTLDNESDASLALGSIYGYDQCVNNISSACIAATTEAVLAESWGAELPLTIKKDSR